MKKQKMLAMLLLGMMSTSLFSGCATKLPVPAVKEGRFNFSITYEVEGEVKTYTGVYVCEYEGAHKFLSGYSRAWSGYVENSDDSLKFPVQTNDEGIIYMGFGLSPSYFMADPDFELMDFETPAPSLYLVYHSDDPNTEVIDGSLDLMAEYGVRLISYDYPEPIENSYEEQWTLARWDIGIN